MLKLGDSDRKRLTVASGQGLARVGTYGDQGRVSRDTFTSSAHSAEASGSASADGARADAGPLRTYHRVGLGIAGVVGIARPDADTATLSMATLTVLRLIDANRRRCPDPGPGHRSTPGPRRRRRPSP